MPWHTVYQHSECPASRPWAVVKDADGEVEGCHDTEEAADRQLAALYASEPDQELDELALGLINLIRSEGEVMADTTTKPATAALATKKKPPKPNPGTPADRRLKRNRDRTPRQYEVEEMPEMAGPFRGWHGVLAVEGLETGDGREFAPDSLEWANPPLPLMWQRQSEPQHNRSVVVGRIDRVERRGAEILGWGVIDLGSEDGAEVARQMGLDVAGGVSVDVDSVKDADVELIYGDDPGQEDVGRDDDVVMLFGPPPEKVLFHRGRVRGATLVALPAFVEARLRLMSDTETDEMLAALADESIDMPEPDAGLVASGGPLYPPSRWFSNPGLDGPTPWTVDDEGRVWGHLALWNSCHTSFADRCVTPPRERDFPFFMKREIETDDGKMVGVGQITMGTGHAGLGLDSRPAAEHYDNTGSALVDCAVGTDKWGIWVAGALRPQVEGAKLRELRAASLSGDWRRIGGKLRLVAVLAVNVPGYPIPLTRARFAAEEPISMVASGVVTEERVARYKLPRVEELESGVVVIRKR